jgi:hypothetical protein
MAKQTGPYLLARAFEAPTPGRFNYVHAYIEGEGLPTLRVVGHGHNADGDQSVYVTGGEPYDGDIASEPVFINRVPHRVNLRLNSTPVGTWVVSRPKDDPQGWYSVGVTRLGSYTTNDASPAARKWVAEVVVPAVLVWLGSAEAQPFLRAGREHGRASAIARAEEALAKANEALVAAQRDIEAALAIPI